MMARICVSIKDDKNKDIGCFLLQRGENKIGRDQSQCNVYLNIPQMEQVQFSIYITDEQDAYIIQHGITSELYKESSIPANPIKKVKLKQGFPYEMVPGRLFFFDLFTFTLTLSENPQLMVNMEQNYNGTLVLDDLQNHEDVANVQTYINNSHTQICGTIVMNESNQRENISLNQISFDMIQKKYVQQQDKGPQANFSIQENSTQHSGFNNHIIKQNQSAPIVKNYFSKAFIPKNMRVKGRFEEEIEKSQFKENPQINVPQMIDKLNVTSQNENVKDDERLSQNLSLLNIQKPLQQQTNQDYLCDKIKHQGQLQSFDDLFEGAPTKSAIYISLSLCSLFKGSQRQQFSVQKSNSDNLLQIEIPSDINKDSAGTETCKQLVTLFDKLFKGEQNSGNISKQKPLMLNQNQKNQNKIKQKISLSNSRLNVGTLVEAEKISNQDNSIISNRKKLKSLFESHHPNFKKIAFSGFTDLPTKNQLLQIGLDLVDQRNECFDVLVMKGCKRTMKLLVALVTGSKVANELWIKESFEKKEQQPLKEYHIPDSCEFTKQFNISLPQLLQKRDDVINSSKDGGVNLFSGYTFIVNNDVKPSRLDVVNLINFGGGKCIEVLPKKINKKLFMVVSDDKTEVKINLQKVTSDQILDAAMLSDFQASQ